MESLIYPLSFRYILKNIDAVRVSLMRFHHDEWHPGIPSDLWLKLNYTVM